MAKYFNNKVKTGRLAGSVFAVRYGETIERAYQPMVNNPKSQAQVEARAKMKLMSQLAAVCAPVIAIPRDGAKSPRNLFISTNYGLTEYTADTAKINLPMVQLTKSIVALPPISAVRAQTGISASLSGQAVASNNPIDVNRIVYCFFEIQADEELRFMTSAVATEAGTGGLWPVNDVVSTARPVVVLAYGIRDNSNKAVVIFGEMTVPSASSVAQLITSRRLTEEDITTTETRGMIVETGA